jgi:hypothetical protein
MVFLSSTTFLVMIVFLLNTVPLGRYNIRAYRFWEQLNMFR